MDVAAVPDGRHEDDPVSVLDSVEDPIVARPDAIQPLFTHPVAVVERDLVRFVAEGGLAFDSVGPLPLAISDPVRDRPGDGHPFARREVLADLVLVAFG